MYDPRDIFKRFSDNSRYVLVASQKIAETEGTGIGSEHILLALTVTSGNLAHELLKENSVNIDQIRLIIRFNNLHSIHGKGLSREAKNLLEKATEKALKLKSELVEPEHLLWAIIEDKECLANKILVRIGVNLNDLKHLLEDEVISEENIDEILNKHLESLGLGLNPKDQLPLSKDFMFFGAGPESFARANKTKTANGQKSNTPTLDYFGTDLTKMARDNKLDPVIGREKEITRMIQILCRRTKNNPVLVGDPGVGKTAIAEGLSQRISQGLAPKLLLDKRVISLDLALIVAGTMYRGQFEERLKKIIEEVIRAKNIILFLDEIHTMVGTGSAEGSMDTANILKPALAKGHLRLIGATTTDEYRKYIEKDAALERRLQPIKIEEPSVEEAIKILAGIKSRYENHHGVKISDSAIEAAVLLSKRYISDRFLPDKAIDLIDESASAMQIANQLLSRNKKSLILEEQLKKVIAEKEQEVDKQNYENAARLKAQEIQLKIQLDKTLAQNKPSKPSTEIDKTDIAKIVSLWTGMPLDNLIETEKIKIVNLNQTLKNCIIGQDEAIESIAHAIKRSKAGIANPKRPIGAFLFLGPTGVGKTELAKVLSDEVFGSEKSLIKIDMSEFMERHNLSRLIGAPPGYVGYEDAGKLTESVRKNPYCLVLLDEIEKAHPEVFNILLQILEDGYLTDAKGKRVNFRNTIIIMTSNIGMQELTKQAALGFQAFTENEKEWAEIKYEKMKQNVLGKLKDVFKPELINRLDKIIVFKPLDKTSIKMIVELQINELTSRLKPEGINIKVDNLTKELIANKGYDPEYGARQIRRTISELVEDQLSDALLSNSVNKNKTITITVKKGKIVIE